MKRKCIIWVTSELPFPSNSGGRIYTWERIKAMKKKGYEIILFTISDNEEVDYNALNQVCKEVLVFERGNKYVKALRCFWNPFSVATRDIPEMRGKILEYINNEEVNTIIADSLFVAKSCLNDKVPVILTQHNIEYVAFKSMALNANNFIKRLVFYREYILCKAYEKRLYKNKCIKGYTFISSEDKEFFDIRNPKKDTLLVPIGTDLQSIDKNIYHYKAGVIVFTGKMDYEPNVQAVVNFAKNIFTKIKKEIPYAKFFIVGKNPTKEVKELEEIEGIVVTGFVDSTEQYLVDANIVVIPLLSGGGVKIKLFEALSYKNIVVTTSKGVEGTSFRDGKELIIREEDDGFAAACIDVIKNTSKYMGLGENGFRYMTEKYSWDSIASNYTDFINQISDVGGL